jgi:hypothetical protein
MPGVKEIKIRPLLANPLIKALSKTFAYGSD